jgi:hypothetical protein
VLVPQFVLLSAILVLRIGNAGVRDQEHDFIALATIATSE